jgi:WD40 repeat protein
MNESSKDHSMGIDRPDYSVRWPGDVASSGTPSIVNCRFDNLQGRWSRRSIITGGLLSLAGLITGCGGGGGSDNSYSTTDQAQGPGQEWYPAHAGQITSVSLSSDGTKLISGSLDGTAKVWNTSSGALLLTNTRATSTHSPAGYVAAMSPDGKHFAAGGSDALVTVCDASLGDVIFNLNDHNATVTCIAFSPDSSQIVSGDANGVIYVCSTATGSLVQEYTQHTAQISSVAFSPDGSNVLSSSMDGTARIWKAATGATLLTISLPDNDLGQPAVSSFGKAVYSADGTEVAAYFLSGQVNVFCWNASTGKQLWISGIDGSCNLAANPNNSDFAYSTPGEMEFATTVDANLTYYMLKDPVEGAAPGFGEPASVTAIAFSPDGANLIEGSQSGALLTRNLSSADWVMFFSDTSLPKQTYNWVNGSSAGAGLTPSSWGGASSAQRAQWCVCDVTCTCNQVCTCNQICTCHTESPCSVVIIDVPALKR